VFGAHEVDKLLVD